MKKVKLFVCEHCNESTLFNVLNPRQFEEIEILSFQRNNSALKHFTFPLPILECLKCKKLILPHSAFNGMSPLDPVVEAYAELRNTVISHNKNIDKNISFIRPDEYIDSTEARILDLELKLNGLITTPALHTEGNALNVKRSEQIIQDNKDLVSKRKKRATS